jgi:hypothetical protein
MRDICQGVGAGLWIVGACQAGHGAPCGVDIGIRGHAEHLVPGEHRLLEPDLDRLRRDLRQQQRQDRCPSGHRGAATAPVVDLARGHAGEAGEPRLGNVGAGQQGGEFGAELSIDL